MYEEGEESNKNHSSCFCIALFLASFKSFSGISFIVSSVLNM
jgi:hypothetical protein